MTNVDLKSVLREIRQYAGPLVAPSPLDPALLERSVRGIRASRRARKRRTWVTVNCGGPGSGKPGPCPDPSKANDQEGAERAYIDLGESVNSLLRSGKPLNDSDSPDGDFEEVVRDLDRVMTPILESRMVYRGMSIRHIPEVGQTFVDRGYFSTSRKKSIALKFKRPDDTGANVDIALPVGAKVLDMKSTTEAETLLARGTKFKVVSKQKITSGWRVKLAVVGTGPTTNAKTPTGRGQFSSQRNLWRVTIRRLAPYLLDLMPDLTKGQAEGIARSIQLGLRSDAPDSEVAAMIEQYDIDPPRSTLIARTEMARARADTELGRLKPNERVVYVLAPDACPKCVNVERKLKGRRLTAKQAQGIIPVHPNCYCRWKTVNVRSGREVTRNEGGNGLTNDVLEFARLVDNANPEGCNQYTGPGCAVGEKLDSQEVRDIKEQNRLSTKHLIFGKFTNTHPETAKKVIKTLEDLADKYGMPSGGIHIVEASGGSTGHRASMGQRTWIAVSEKEADRLKSLGAKINTIPKPGGGRINRVVDPSTGRLTLYTNGSRTLAGFDQPPDKYHKIKIKNVGHTVDTGDGVKDTITHEFGHSVVNRNLTEDEAASHTKEKPDYSVPYISRYALTSKSEQLAEAFVKYDSGDRNPALVKILSPYLSKLTRNDANGFEEVRNDVLEYSRLVDNCGGPGSGVPGPCPDPTKSDMAKVSNQHYQASFEHANQKYTVNIFNVPVYDEYPGERSWGLVFGVGSKDDVHLEMGRTGKVGTKALGVFRKVGAAVDDFMKQVAPERLHFSAEKISPTRVKLYDRLSSVLAERHGYTIDVRDDNVERLYFLNKNKTATRNQVLEDFGNAFDRTMNVFCATGEGGGVDPSCFSGEGDKSTHPLLKNVERVSSTGSPRDKGPNEYYRVDSLGNFDSITDSETINRINDLMDDARLAAREHVDPSSLISTQEVVEADTLDYLLHQAEISDDYPVKVFEDEDGARYLLDGHTRSLAATMKGQDTVYARIYRVVSEE